jgi:ATP-dependent Lhr-like helicase
VRDPLEAFHPATRTWFEETLSRPTPVQAATWPLLARGRSVLVASPTGTGKTLAAFLAAIDRLAHAPEPPRGERLRVLYVSPLRALAVDVERNLRAPLRGVLTTGARDGHPVRPVTVGLRTGDTPSRERVAMLRTPPDVLVTTPESLYLLLTSRARELLATVDTVIVDEIHQLVPTKRGAHFLLSLERLEDLRPRSAPPLVRVGLSATQRPLDVVARALAGRDAAGPRPITIVDQTAPRPLSLRIDVPPILSERVDEDPELAAREGRESVWPTIHERILAQVRAHRSTIVFANSRRLAERLAAALNELAGEEIALAHHGSVAREKRAEVEERLKRGAVPCIVATSSLELGIDMGAVDLVIQVEAPPSVASGLQRIGRASHHVGGVPEGVLFPKSRGDLVATVAAAEGVLAGEVEETRYPKNALDVLAQQIVAMCVDREVPVKDLLAMVRRAAPYEDLPESALRDVLDMLGGKYPSEAFAALRPRIVWDRKKDVLRAREGARTVAIGSGGTIPDRGLFGVYFWPAGGKARRVGELDEEMVFEMREGDVFLLGATSWRTVHIGHDRVLVEPAPGEPGRMPFWRGDGPGRSKAFGARIGALLRDLEAGAPNLAARLARIGVAEDGLRALAKLVADQRERGGVVPTDRRVVVERFVDDVGDHRVVVLSPLGARVLAPWGLLAAARLRDAGRGEPDLVTTDDGFALRVAAGGAPPATSEIVPPASAIDERLRAELARSPIFAAAFRESAARALLLPRRLPGARTPLWAQRRRARDLFAVAARFDGFPIVLEAFRECLSDIFDVSGLRELLGALESGEAELVVVDTAGPSPLAGQVLFSFVGCFMYQADLPLAERRAQALAVDPERLRELLGEVDLRAVLDPAVCAEHERALQRLRSPARGVDGAHDLLLSLGDVSVAELGARLEGRADAIAAELVREGRAYPMTIGAEERIVAAEDVARVAAALGAALPAGLPDALATAPEDAMRQLVARYARTHGPFRADDVARRLGVAVERVTKELAILSREGRLVRGRFPHGSGEGDADWCATDVLAVVRRRTLAELRRAIEPAPMETLGRFLLDWHGIVGPGRGDAALEAAVDRLAGLALPVSALETDVLPARVAGYAPQLLDAACATGAVVWVGVERLGATDARIALYPADRELDLAPPPGEAPGALPARIRRVLEDEGALFFADLHARLGGFEPELRAALWDMVFAQELTNDTLEPVRSFARRQERATPRGAPPRRPAREGRWTLRRARWPRYASPTECATALARTLLRRHGILSREAVAEECVAGGFAALYPVLCAMEDAGQVRRGWFVRELSALQFALPGSDDRLRTAASARVAPCVLSAVDPASPWGALVSWPAPRGSTRPQRAAGARVVLTDGALGAWLGATGALATFAATPANARDVARALAGLAAREPARVVALREIDGAPARESDLAPALVDAGFRPSGPGFVFRALPTCEGAS